MWVVGLIPLESLFGWRSGFNVIGRRCFSGRCGLSQSGPGRVRPHNSDARCFSGLVARLGRTLFRSRRRWNRSGILLFRVLLDGISVAPLLTTGSILICGAGGSGVLGVTGIGAPADTVAGFSNGMGVAGLALDAAVLVLLR